MNYKITKEKEFLSKGNKWFSHVLYKKKKLSI